MSKKENKIITLFDNYNDYDFEQEKVALQECNPDIEVTDNMVWDSINELEREDWENCIAELKELFGDNRVIALGKAGTWRGRFECAKMFDDIEKAVSACIKDCDYIKVEQVGNGLIQIESSHHDGTNTFSIKVVTDKGQSVYDSWLYSDKSKIGNLDTYQVLEKIWKSNLFSKNVKLAA